MRVRLKCEFVIICVFWLCFLIFDLSLFLWLVWWFHCFCFLPSPSVFVRLCLFVQPDPFSLLVYMFILPHKSDLFFPPIWLILDSLNKTNLIFKSYPGLFSMWYWTAQISDVFQCNHSLKIHVTFHQLVRCAYTDRSKYSEYWYQPHAV